MKTVRFSLFVVILSVSLSACWPPCTEDRNNIYQNLRSEVNNNDTIDFKRIAPFEWERLLVAYPYTNPSTIDLHLGFKWSCSLALGLHETDSKCVLVFVKGSEVVDFATIPRNVADFVTNNGTPLDEYTPLTARFVKESEKTRFILRVIK